MRVKYWLTGAAALLLTSSTSWAQTAPVQASAEMEQALTITLIDANVDCGKVLLSAPAVCTDGAIAANKATVEVIANANWTVTFEDLGGANVNEISMSAPTGRNGHFIMLVSVSQTNGTATGSTMIDIVGTGLDTGSNARGLDSSDDYGIYYGEALLTLSGT